MKHIIDRLCSRHSLDRQEYLELLQCNDVDTMDYLRSQAQSATLERFGRDVYVRGLIEITNECRNNCLYCGIRQANKMVARYSLSQATILDCCQQGYELGFRTFVLQGGENPQMTDEWVEDTVARIHSRYPDCAITLSLGERSLQAYKAFFKAGASRYLLRHETITDSHYRRLHPTDMSLQNRIQCLHDLKEIGYQTGTGIMVGSTYKNLEKIADDLKFIEEFKPQMIGIGPFIPHAQTPFAGASAGSVELTLKLISIFRLMSPSALIPSTTALASLSADGRCQGILAGANVVMPNLSPPTFRGQYSLYNNKAAFGSESAEGLRLLQEELNTINYNISTERGDYVQT